MTLSPGKICEIEREHSEYVRGENSEAEAGMFFCSVFFPLDIGYKWKDEQNVFNETNKNAKEDLMFKVMINQKWQLKCNTAPWDWGNKFIHRADVPAVKKKKKEKVEWLKKRQKEKEKMFSPLLQQNKSYKIKINYKGNIACWLEAVQSHPCEKMHIFIFSDHMHTHI